MSCLIISISNTIFSVENGLKFCWLALLENDFISIFRDWFVCCIVSVCFNFVFLSFSVSFSIERFWCCCDLLHFWQGSFNLFFTKKTQKKRKNGKVKLYKIHLLKCHSISLNSLNKPKKKQNSKFLQEYRRSMAMLEYIRNSHNGTATFGGYENRHR